MWILIGFLIALTLSTVFFVWMFSKVKKRKTIEAVKTTTTPEEETVTGTEVETETETAKVAPTPNPSPATVVTVTEKKSSKILYGLAWLLGLLVVVFVALAIFPELVVKYVSTFESGNIKSTPTDFGFVKAVAPFVLAIVAGGLVYYSNKSVGGAAFVSGMVAIVIALWLHFEVVMPYVEGLFTNAPPVSVLYLIPVLVGIFVYYTSPPSKYKNLPYALCSVALAALVLYIFTQPAEFMESMRVLMGDDSLYPALQSKFQEGFNYAYVVLATIIIIVFLFGTGHGIAALLLIATAIVCFLMSLSPYCC